MLKALSLALVAITTAPQDGLSRPDEAVVEDVVVTASRDAPAFNPFSPFEDICFNGNRLERSAREPMADDPFWIELDARERARVGVVEDRVKAFRQERADVSLLLKIDESAVDGLIQNRCHIIVVGQHDAGDLIAGMRRLFSTAGTRTHVGRVQGYRSMPGWQQWAWTAMPGKKTTRWEGFASNEGPGIETSGYLMVARPFFYRQYAWVIGDLRFSEDREVPVSELTLTLRYKP